MNFLKNLKRSLCLNILNYYEIEIKCLIRHKIVSKSSALIFPIPLYNISLHIPSNL
jgi:hypothetical protein